MSSNHLAISTKLLPDSELPVSLWGRMEILGLEPENTSKPLNISISYSFPLNKKKEKDQYTDLFLAFNTYKTTADTSPTASRATMPPMM